MATMAGGCGGCGMGGWVGGWMWWPTVLRIIGLRKKETEERGKIIKKQYLNEMVKKIEVLTCCIVKWCVICYKIGF